MASPNDADKLVADFCDTCATSPDVARHYLEAHHWDMTAACNSYFTAEDDHPSQPAAPGPVSSAPGDSYNGPRTLDGRPAPDSAPTPSRSLASSSQQPKKKGIATLGSLRESSHQQQHDDEGDGDDDDHLHHHGDDQDGRGNLFAGGEKSGLAVQDPRQEGGARGIVNSILAKAMAQARRPEAAAEAEASASSPFRGTGVTLGGDGVESRSIPDPLAPSRSGPETQPQERVLHIWLDGFSVDDGPLRRFDDPANQADLMMIRQGRAPLHLMNVEHDQPVEVKLHQHENAYVTPAKSYKPFSGAGHRLGSPVPGASTASTVDAAAPQQKQPTAASSSPASPAIDESQPTVMIRIQLPDGTRLPARFNTTSTIGDIYDFVDASSSETRSRRWVLATTFPNQDHQERSLLLGDVAEFKKGGAAVVKWL